VKWSIITSSFFPDHLSNPLLPTNRGCTSHLIWLTHMNFLQMHPLQWRYHIEGSLHIDVPKPMTLLNVAAGSPADFIMDPLVPNLRRSVCQEVCPGKHYYHCKKHFPSLVTYVPEICIVLPVKVWPWRLDDAITYKHREGHCHLQLTGVRQQTQRYRTADVYCHTGV